MTGIPPRVNEKTLIHQCEQKSYRHLLGDAAWFRLNPSIRQRFGSHHQEAVIYRGIMEKVESSLVGKIIAHLCRMIGSPLAPYTEANVPMTVHVYYNELLDGLTWNRTYHYQHHPVAVAKSTKCINPKTGLMELVERGCGMDLTLSEESGALHFHSTDYFCRVLGKKLRIPGLFTPGKTHVIQEAIDEINFRFTLKIVHPFFGKTFFQTGIFHEVSEFESLIGMEQRIQ
jgi:hypothetical protein